MNKLQRLTALFLLLIAGLCGPADASVRGGFSRARSQFSAVSITISAANANLSSGTPTPGSTVQVSLPAGLTSAYVSVISNSGSGTLVFQTGDTANPTNWQTVNSSFITNITSGATGSISASASGGYVVSPIGGATIRVAASAWFSGSVTILIIPGGSIGGGSSSGSVSLTAPFGQSNMAGSLPVTIAADQSAVGVQTAQPYTLTMANPSVSTATSTTLLAAGTYHLIWIQNNTAANIAISLTGATLTGITPTSSNNCIVVAAGQLMFLPVNAVPTAAITCYQTSGSTTNAITVVSG